MCVCVCVRVCVCGVCVCVCEVCVRARVRVHVSTEACYATACGLSTTTLLYCHLACTNQYLHTISVYECTLLSYVCYCC